MQLLTVLVVALASSIRPTSSLGFHTLVPERFQECCGDEQLPNCAVVESIARGPDGNHYVFTSGSIYQVRITRKGFPEVHENSMWDEKVWFQNTRQDIGQTAVNETTAAVLVSIGNDPPVMMVAKGGLFYKFKKLPTEEGSNGEAIVEITNDCHDLHPLFCDDSLGDLVDATVSNIRGTSSEDEVKAYYRQLNSKGTADYHERNYVGYRPAGRSVDVPFESVSSVTVYDAEIRVFDNIQRDLGYVFEDNGFACRWELYRNERQLQLVDALREPLVNCLPTNVFLGCPQSWCLNSAVDDLLVTTLPLDDGNVARRLVVYRGHYQFDTEPTVPASVPKATRMRLSHDSQKATARRHPYIDAAFEVDFFGDRSFTGFVKDTDVVIYDSATGDKVEKKIYDVFPRLWSSLVGNDNLGTIDAAFLTPARELVLLIGAKYIVYTYDTRQVPNGLSLVFKFVRDGWVFNDFQGLPLNVDGAVDLNGKVYVFKDNWVYTTTEISSLAGSAKWTPEFAYYNPRTRTGFWNIAGVCRWTDDVWTAIRRNAKPPASLRPPNYQAPAGFPFLPVLGFIMLLVLNFLPFVMTFFSDPELEDEQQLQVTHDVGHQDSRLKGILTLHAAKTRHNCEETPAVHVCAAEKGEPCNCPSRNNCSCRRSSLKKTAKPTGVHENLPEAQTNTDVPQTPAGSSTTTNADIHGDQASPAQPTTDGQTTPNVEEPAETELFPRSLITFDAPQEPAADVGVSNVPAPPPPPPPPPPAHDPPPPYPGLPGATPAPPVTPAPGTPASTLTPSAAAHIAQQAQLNQLNRPLNRPLPKKQKIPWSKQKYREP